jgi:hypothetical protein
MTKDERIRALAKGFRELVWAILEEDLISKKNAKYNLDTIDFFEDDTNHRDEKTYE